MGVWLLHHFGLQLGDKAHCPLGIVFGDIASDPNLIGAGITTPTDSDRQTR